MDNRRKIGEDGDENTSGEEEQEEEEWSEEEEEEEWSEEEEEEEKEIRFLLGIRPAVTLLEAKRILTEHGIEIMSEWPSNDELDLIEVNSTKDTLDEIQKAHGVFQFYELKSSFCFITSM